MAKDSNPGNRSAQVAKAGKRSGQAIYPAPLSSEKLAAHEQGEQQFIANKTLTVEREATIIMYDKALKGFVYRTKKITLPTEWVFDETRGRIVYSPSFKEKQNR